MIDTLRSMLLPLTPLAVIDVGMNLLKILAVAGGATVGGIGGGLLLRLIAKVSFGRNTPRVPLRIHRGGRVATRPVGRGPAGPIRRRR